MSGCTIEVRTLMKAIGAMICILLVGVASASLRAEEKVAADRPAYTNVQIKKMAREAHTPEQYNILANYYSAQQRVYAAKAVEMMHLWRQRNEMYYRVEKWPRPVDSARNLHDYYEYKADEAARLQSLYARRAGELGSK
jgi:hypothetical protein